MARNIMQVATEHSAWVAARRTVIASNVANANTPGYRAKDVSPFSLQAESGADRLAVTHAAHIKTAGGPAGQYDGDEAGQVETFHSGSSVNLDGEMVKSSEVSSQQALNAAVVKAFHRMLIASTKG